MNRSLLQLLPNIFSFLFVCSLPTSVFSTHYYERIDLSENLVSPKTMELVGLGNLRLEKRNLSYKDLSGQDLTNLFLPEANLQATMMMESNLTGTILIGANLKDAFFTKAILIDANLSNSDLSGADFRGANLTGANLSGANLTWARFDENTIFFHTKLEGCNISNNGIDYYLSLSSSQTFPKTKTPPKTDEPSFNDKDFASGESQDKCKKYSLTKAAGRSYRKMFRNASDPNLSNSLSHLSEASSIALSGSYIEKRSPKSNKTPIQFVNFNK